MCDMIAAVDVCMMDELMSVMGSVCVRVWVAICKAMCVVGEYVVRGMWTVVLAVSVVLNAYIGFISNKSNYAYLTIVSELLNLGRVYPAVYIAKVIVDMHREYMKLCL